MGYHEAVLLDESIAGLSIQPNGIYVDVTFGGGGHSKSILQKLEMKLLHLIKIAMHNKIVLMMIV